MSKPEDKSRWSVASNLPRFLSKHVPNQAPLSPPTMLPSKLPNIPNFEDYLLQPADDGTIRNTWILLGSLIISHVKEFYQSEFTISSVENIAKDLDYYEVVTGSDRIRDLSTLIYWPQYRHLGLRICIARVLLSSIDFRGYSDETSLNVEVIALLQKFHKVHPTANAVDEVALAKWRMITAFLLSPPSTSTRESRQEERFPCVETLDEVLGRFAKKSENEEDTRANRIRSLHTLATRTAAFGEKLFGHPSTWIFQWTTQNSAHTSRKTSEDTENGTATFLDDEKDKVVLFPALLRSDAPTKATAKQKGRPIVVHPADVGRGFLSKEITMLEKRKPDPVRSLNTAFSGMDLPVVEQGSNLAESAYGGRGSPVRRPSMPVEYTFEEENYAQRPEKSQIGDSRQGYPTDDYGQGGFDQPGQTYWSREEEHERPSRRRGRRKRNRSQGAKK